MQTIVPGLYKSWKLLPWTEGRGQQFPYLHKWVDFSPRSHEIPFHYRFVFNHQNTVNGTPTTVVDVGHLAFREPIWVVFIEKSFRSSLNQSTVFCWPINSFFCCPHTQKLHEISCNSQKCITSIYIEHKVIHSIIFIAVSRKVVSLLFRFLPVSDKPVGSFWWNLTIHISWSFTSRSTTRDLTYFLEDLCGSPTI